MVFIQKSHTALQYIALVINCHIVQPCFKPTVNFITQTITLLYIMCYVNVCYMHLLCNVFAEGVNTVEAAGAQTVPRDHMHFR